MSHSKFTSVQPLTVLISAGRVCLNEAHVPAISGIKAKRREDGGIRRKVARKKRVYEDFSDRLSIQF